jgi:NAD(P)H-hydrate epimerase
MGSPHPAITVIDALPALPPRPRAAHKGTFGKVLVVAGSRGMSGAAVLCASGALRGGAGLVTLAVAEAIHPVVATANPCYLTLPLPGDEHGRIDARAFRDLFGQMQASTATVLGPGLGQSNGLATLVQETLRQARTPLVLDADALNLLVGHLDWLSAHSETRILTPHPGEFARLLGTDTSAVQSRRVELATRFAADHRVILVLKGQGTVVTDGGRLFVNPTGNPGMATGGSGDVLTGLLGALLAQGLEPFAAAQLGVYLHGLAGDLARDQLGEASLIASDLLTYLPYAFLAHQRQSPQNQP